MKRAGASNASVTYDVNQITVSVPGVSSGECGLAINKLIDNSNFKNLVFVTSNEVIATNYYGNTVDNLTNSMSYIILDDATAKYVHTVSLKPDLYYESVGFNVGQTAYITEIYLE